MTSPASIRECYVYIQLPRSLDLVTCGRYQRETLSDGRVIGRFVYGQTYRRRPDAVPLDPYDLPLAATPYETARLHGMFGAIRDASPDAWGRSVIERMAGRGGLDEMDFLLYAPEDRAGALLFGLGVEPPPPIRAFNRVVQLHELLDAVHQLEDMEPGDPVPSQIRQLVDPGSSLGGARPKNVVEDSGQLWIAKFPQRGDRWSHAPVEAGMLALAHQCGIRVPPTRVESIGTSDVLLVQRFDRERAIGGYYRNRFLSGLTVLQADDGGVDRTNWSYLLLADQLQRWSERPDDDRRELFRRMVVNALISNGDDHPRNHAVIAPGRHWRLSPAYDLTPQPGRSIERRDLALTCGVFGRVARRDNLLSTAPRFGLMRDDATTVIDDIQAIIVASWRPTLRRHGATDRDCDIIASAINYPGFEYATSP